ncbi:BglG family transcription antiterminator [Nesterenkonia flava]|uniref:PTS sugar transporter subunit IIA n=1 Tax=Nesterenkonia flava TaxID=469799 RepID=A0ABU1FQK3_9MICC|nr:PTS sugar transporter subunit IIA [Nesterenkonia flava]MDR5710930.1 PTS sugar transporter subunit IIA [Nesterenkonia flava]
MSRRQDQLVNLLMRDDGWITAAALADLLGVTPRSVRNYIAQLNARTSQTPAVESGPAGYRANRPVLAGLRRGEAKTSPRDRLHTVVRELLEADSGIDIHRTAERLHVSEATLEADLARVRELLESAGLEGLSLERSGPRVMLLGSELAQRRLVSKLAHEEMKQGAFDLEHLRRSAGISADKAAFGPFRRELTAGLVEQGYYVNELAAADVLLHVAIAADRVGHGRALEVSPVESGEHQQKVADLLDRLAVKHLGVSMGRGDLHHLASLVLTRAVAPKSSARNQVALDPRVEAAVSRAVDHAAQEYLVDIRHADFIQRLSLHVQNLVLRAREQAWSRNPLTRSLKSTYPMVFQVAVSISSDIGEELGLSLGDDEIAYIAMHVGGRLERSRRAEAVLTATIVCPGYYELHELLRSRIDRSLGASVEVVSVETNMDPDWSAITTDLVLTTIEPESPDERTVLLPPFLTEADTERIAAAVARRRRALRLARLRAELEHYVSPEAFIRPLEAADEESAIRTLGAPLVAQGVIDEDYVERAVARERLSSTAFTEMLAVPHALKMTAGRTALSIGIADGSVRWGEGRVQIVVLVAFSEEDREAFQTIFEQLVEVFSERESVTRILRRGTDFTRFLDELVAVIDG